MRLGLRRYLALLSIVAVLGAVAVVIFSPDWHKRLKSFTEQQIRQSLQSIFGQHVDFAGPSFDFGTEQNQGIFHAERNQDIVIRNLVVRAQAGGAPVIEAAEVRIYFDPWTLVKMEVPEVVRVDFRRPRISITRDENGLLNLATLAESIDSYRSKLGAQVGTKSPPTVRIEDGTIDFFDDKYLSEHFLLEKMNLEVAAAGAGTNMLGIHGYTMDDSKWKFGGEVEMVSGRPHFRGAWLTGRNLQVSDSWAERLQGGLREALLTLMPGGTLKELKIDADFDPSGELVITGSLDSDALTFDLLRDTIGERVRNVHATAQLRASGATFEATAEPDVGVPADEGTATLAALPPSLATDEAAEVGVASASFRLTGAFGGASTEPGHNVVRMQLAGLQIDRDIRKSISQIERIGRRLRGEHADRAGEDFDRIWGENTAQQIFDRYNANGELTVDARVLLPQTPGSQPRFSGEITIEDGSLQLPVSSQALGGVPIEELRGTFTFEGDTLGVKEGTWVQGLLNGSVVRFQGRVSDALEPQVRNWYVDIRADDLRLDDQFLHQLSPPDEGGEPAGWLKVLMQYQVRGTADILVKLLGGPGGSPYRIVSVEPKGDMSFVPPQFPYPVEGVHGTLSIAGTHTDFSLIGRAPHSTGNSAIELSGRIENELIGDRLSVMFVRAKNLSIDETYYAALQAASPEVANLLMNDLMASGHVDVAMRWERRANPSGGEPITTTNINVDLLDCVAQWRGVEQLFQDQDFRYKISGIRGTVKVRDNHVELEDVRGWSEDGEKFAFDGSFDDSGTPDARMRLHIAAERLGFSDNLRKLLGTVDNAYFELWRDFSPEGEVAFDYEVSEGPGDEHHTLVRIEPQGCTAIAVAFPMEVRNIESGSITIEDGVVRIENLVSRDGGSRIEVNGTVDTTQADEAVVDLEVTADSLTLSDELYRALPESVRQVWDEFRPQGAVNVFVKLNREAGDATQDLAIHVDVEFLDVAGRYEHVPVPLSNITGRLLYSSHDKAANGDLRARIEFDSLRAQLLGGHLEVVSGTILGEGPTRWTNLHVVGTDLDTADAGWMTVDARASSLRDVLEPQGRANFDCVFAMEGATMGKLTGQGTLTAQALSIRDVKVENLSAEVFLKDGILSYPEIRGTIYGGRLEAQLSVDTSSFGAFGGKVEVTGVSVGPFVRDALRSKASRLSGRLAAELEFGGLGPSRDSIVGRGSLNVKDGWLWELPVFLQIMDSVKPGTLATADSRAFRECEARFTVSNGIARFDKINIDANSLRIQGRGDMDLSGGLDMVIAVSATPDNKIPVLSDLLSGVAGNLIGFAVKGTYRDPKLEVQPIKLVTDILAGLADSVGADITPKE